MMQSRPTAVLLDRDGVINVDSLDYILTPQQWKPIPGSLEAIATLTSAEIPVAIISNQSALGRGMLDQQTFQGIHSKMMRAIEAAGGKIVHVAYCPHAPEEQCTCRKPKPGLIDEALTHLGINVEPENVIFIGDSLRDVQAALNAGVAPILVQTSHSDATAILEQARQLLPDIRHFSDLAAAVNDLLESMPC